MKRILICTQNQGKFIEITHVLKDLKVELVSPKELNIHTEIEETGSTYEENAILKAKTLGDKTGLISLGDDAGIEVSALNGAPGVHSKRYFKTSGEERNRELLDLIKDSHDKKAQFVSTIAVYNPGDKSIKTFTHEQNGILIESRGESKVGLGYDSIFYTPEFNKTNAELSLEEKSQISHRGLAVKKAKDYLSTLI